MKKREILEIRTMVDDSERGKLSVIESLKDIPFIVRRVYYIHSKTDLSVRGNLAHKKTDQLLIALNGKIKITVDNGKIAEEIILENNEEGFLFTHGQWITMEWIDQDAILLVLASDYYNSNDYIRNYDEFLKFIQ